MLSAQAVGDDFNARMSAVKRHYLYRIINRRPDLTVDAGRAWRIPRPLDDVVPAAELADQDVAHIADALRLDVLVRARVAFGARDERLLFSQDRFECLEPRASGLEVRPNSEIDELEHGLG